MQYKFVPTDDITIKELADIISKLDLTVTAGVLNTLYSGDALRHWKPTEPVHIEIPQYEDNR